MSQHLIIQGPEIATGALKQLARLSEANGIEQLSPQAFRLTNVRKPVVTEEITTLCTEQQLDYAFIPSNRRIKDFGLLVTDMDSTLITIECIDEIAAMIGIKEKVAQITEAAMRGELDFAQSLTQRVALLRGVNEADLLRVYDEKLKLTPGAEQMLKTLRANNIATVLVSGGFTFFTERLKQRLDLTAAYANVLEIEAGKLTGKILGPILDAAGKRTALQEWQQKLNLQQNQVIALGDGANDLVMFSAAGISLAYHAKPKVQAAASYCLNYSDLAGVEFVLGTQ